jgi:diadenosine tetraphosphatase ApaH/serine/threonine PP2A family protein phosphatase
VRYAVLSDIHGNLQALRAVLKAVDDMELDHLVCLGDVVGYGANPNEVIELISERSEMTIRGNHDEAALDPSQEAYFNAWAVEAIRWTREQLTDESVSFLSELPYVNRLDDVLLVHASPRDPEKWRYILSPQAAAAEFDAFEESFCLIGHSHVPMIVLRTEVGASELLEDEVALPAGARVIMNVGSVGQPRDGDPRACFAVLDIEDRSASLVRVRYDAEAAHRLIIEAGLPFFLGERLLLGQ